MRKRALSAILLSLAILASAVAPRVAQAVELYEELPPPRTVLVYPPARPARVVLVSSPPPPRTVYAPPPSDPSAPRLVLGAGLGPMFTLSAASPSVVPIGHAHVGFAVDAVEFGVRVGFAPYAASLANADGEDVDTGLYTTDATFTLRLFEDADVRPVLGAGVGAVIATPEGSAPAAGFGLSARAGLELAFDFEDGEVGAGLDGIVTQVVGAEDGFPWELGTTLTVGAHLDYRF